MSTYTHYFPGEQTVKPSDAAELDRIVAQFAAARAAHRDPMSFAFDRCGISRGRFYTLVRKYLPTICVKLGVYRATYHVAYKEKSGRGDFGRLGGSTNNARYHKPYVVFKDNE